MNRQNYDPWNNEISLSDYRPCLVKLSVLPTLGRSFRPVPRRNAAAEKNYENLLKTFNPKKFPLKKYIKGGNTFPILVVFSVWTGRKPWTGPGNTVRRRMGEKMTCFYN
jgi:hypothetical protein